MAVRRAASRSMPGLLHQRGRERAGQEPDERLGDLGRRRPVGLHAHGVDDRVGPTSTGALAELAGEVVDLGEVEDLDAVAGRHGEALGHEVDAEDLGRAAVPGDPSGHLADRAEAEDGDGAALGDVGVLDGLPGGGQHVGEEQEPLVRGTVGHLDRPVLGLGHPQVLGLAAGHLAVELSCSRAARRRCRARAPGSSRTGTAGRCPHMQQCPQEMLKGITTRSPGAMCVTADPTASTMPMGSWPRMSPSSRNGPEQLVEVEVGAAERRSR